MIKVMYNWQRKIGDFIRIVINTLMHYLANIDKNNIWFTFMHSDILRKHSDLRTTAVGALKSCQNGIGVWLLKNEYWSCNVISDIIYEVTSLQIRNVYWLLLDILVYLPPLLANLHCIHKYVPLIILYNWLKKVLISRKSNYIAKFYVCMKTIIAIWLSPEVHLHLYDILKGTMQVWTVIWTWHIFIVRNVRRVAIIII